MLLPDSELITSLQSFDPKIFISDNRTEKEVCNFMLMLALVYNDFRDILWSMNQLEKTKPDAPKISAYNGLHSGMNRHMMRLLCAHFYELAELIEANQEVFQSDLFKKAINQINRRSRGHWEELLSFAFKTEKESKLKKILLIVRGNLSYHYYQPKWLGQGYEKFFNGKDKGYVSRGISLSSARFYFADAAVDGCFTKIIEESHIDMPTELAELAKSVNWALYDIVESFMEIRGARWYDEPL